jgi:hypothetical protein
MALFFCPGRVKIPPLTVQIGANYTDPITDKLCNPPRFRPFARKEGDKISGSLRLTGKKWAA